MRAAFFHLGIFVWLAEQDRLKDVTGIVSVSGGSILTGRLAKRWEQAASRPEGFRTMAAELIQFARQNLRDRVLVRWVWSRLQAIAQLLRKRAATQQQQFATIAPSAAAPRPQRSAIKNCSTNSIGTSIRRSSKSRIYALATGDFIRKSRDASLICPPGVGKSHIVQTVGRELIHAGYAVLYRSIFDCVRDFLHDEAFDGHDKVMAKYLKPDLLILDDMGMKQLPKKSGEFLFEVIMRRHELKSTMMTSNRALEDWGKLMATSPRQPLSSIASCITPS